MILCIVVSPHQQMMRCGVKDAYCRSDSPRYGLKIHPEKTRLVRFCKPNDRDGDSGRPETFDLLGFTNY